MFQKSFASCWFQQRAQGMPGALDFFFKTRNHSTGDIRLLENVALKKKRKGVSLTQRGPIFFPNWNTGPLRVVSVMVDAENLFVGVVATLPVPPSDRKYSGRRGMASKCDCYFLYISLQVRDGGNGTITNLE